jgi:glycosyltransferase involved in cell wall biosynthesis
MSSPFFSVIVPVYNAVTTVQASIESVIAQSDGDFEVILIDDGSTDGSLAIMLAMANSDPRIKAMSQTNQGVAATRNFGVSMSRGVMLAFLDADDIWHPEKLARHRAFHAAHPRIDASYARIAFVGPNDREGAKPQTLSTVLPEAATVEQFLAENPVCTTSNLVVTREAFVATGPFRAGMSFAEDQEWLARAAAKGATICGIDEVLVDYRLSQDGLSINLERMYAGWRQLAQEYYAIEQLRHAEAIYCRYLARRALRSAAHPSVAMSYVLRGLRLDSAAFLNDAKRGWLTLLSAFAAHLLPRAARLRVFA